MTKPRAEKALKPRVTKPEPEKQSPPEITHLEPQEGAAPEAPEIAVPEVSAQPVELEAPEPSEQEAAAPAVEQAPLPPVQEAEPVQEEPAEEHAAPRPIHRREPGGRPDPHYVADLLAKSGRHLEEDDDHAFLERPESDDPFAEERGEDFILGATSGEDADEQVLDPSEPAPEESGFVITTGKEEFGREPDESNPEDAEVEAFPTTRSED